MRLHNVSQLVSVVLCNLRRNKSVNYVQHSNAEQPIPLIVADSRSANPLYIPRIATVNGGYDIVGVVDVLGNRNPIRPVGFIGKERPLFDHPVEPHRKIKFEN